MKPTDSKAAREAAAAALQQAEARSRAADTADAKRATWIAAVLDALLGAVKVITGFVVGSAALIADGIHSVSDLITDGFVLAATHYGRQGPDHDHQYGHGRIETLATLLLGSVLIFVAGAIVWASMYRLATGVEISPPGLIAMLVALLALISKETLFHYTMRVAKRTRSKLLEGNAWHSRSDALSTGVVLIALIGAQFGAGWMDAAAAALVGILVGKVGWDLVWESARELVDTAVPPETHQRLEDTAMAVAGVEGVHDLRTRQSAGRIMVDLHIVVGPKISVSEAHEIGNEVSRRMRLACTEIADITFHIDPEDDEGQGDPSQLPGLPLRPAIEATLEERWSPLPAWTAIKEVRLHYLEHKVSLEVWLDPDGKPVVDQQMAVQLTAALDDLPWLDEVQIVGRLK
ncbi:MAG: cation diffusion facilitator family transporter [Wenzhouxiangella sp.]